jgi:hypothetical protein
LANPNETSGYAWKPLQTELSYFEHSKKKKKKRILLQAPEGGVISRAFDAITVFSNQRASPWSPSHLEELVDGSGGTVAHLAKLILRHLSHFATKANDPDAYYHLQGGLNILENLENGLGSLINTPLLRHRIITTLVCAMRCILGTRDDSTDVLYCYFVPLTRKLATSHHRWMVDALKAGLLHFMISYAAQHVGLNSDLLPVTWFLEEELTRSTVYYPIVSQFLLDVAPIQDTPGFQSSHFFPAWKSFVEVASRRIKLRHDHDSRESKSLGACDNIGVSTVVQHQIY